MPHPIHAVKVPRARFLQLQSLAERHGTSAAGAIEHLLSNAVERGELPDDSFAGIAIARGASAVVVTLDDSASLRLTPPEACDLANLIQGFAGRAIDGSSVAFTAAAGDVITLRRVGRAFGIASGGARIVVSAGMASDIARQLRGAAS